MTPEQLDVAASAVRALSYLAATAMAGVIVIAWLDALGLPGQRQASDGLRLAGLAATAAMAIAHLGKVWVQASAFVDPGDTLGWYHVETIVVVTRWGQRWLLQELLAVVAHVTWMVPSRSRVALTVRTLATIGAIGILPLTGHAAAHAEQLATALLLQGLHVVAVAAWIGALAGLAWRARRVVQLDAPSVAAWGRFSRLARVCVPIAIATGAIRAAQNLTAVEELWRSPWGRALLAKVAMAAVALAFGWRNWKRHLPASVGTGAVTVPFARAVSLELSCSVAAMFLTAWLSGQTRGIDEVSPPDLATGTSPRLVPAAHVTAR